MVWNIIGWFSCLCLILIGENVESNQVSRVCYGICLMILALFVFIPPLRELLG